MKKNMKMYVENLKEIEKVKLWLMISLIFLTITSYEIYFIWPLFVLFLSLTFSNMILIIIMGHIDFEEISFNEEEIEEEIEENEDVTNYEYDENDEYYYDKTELVEDAL